MTELWNFCLLTLFVLHAKGLTLEKEVAVLFPKALAVNEECDPSAIEVMENFDMKRFSGSWYELAKSLSGYIEVNDGMWKIQTANNSSTFLFSGRDSNGHCIRPIKGKMHTSDQPAGTIKLNYQTYSTRVEETIRVLYTDYTSIAVIYLCMHHVHREKQMCHGAGLMGAIWTRHEHVERSVYEAAQRHLEMACVHSSILILRNQIGPCKVDDIGFRIDDFPAPDYCYQPQDKGYCRGSIQKYFYDPREKTCHTFVYSGCGGNRNNFMSLLECEENCLSPSLKEPACPDVAPCALHCSPCCSEDRDKCVKCDCEHIIEDNFLNCMKSPAYCHPECDVEEFNPGCYICSCDDENEPFIDMPVCIEVQAKGDCTEELERYFFNADTGKCEIFTYTGCKGNKNNFETMEQCIETCQDSLNPRTMKTNIELDDDDSSATIIHYSQWTMGYILMLIIIILSNFS